MATATAAVAVTRKNAITKNNSYNITESERTDCSNKNAGDEDKKLRCKAHDQGKELLEIWLSARSDDIGKLIDLFDEEGVYKKPIPATAFSDLYKWTMMPVIRKLETYKSDSVTVTFGIDLRDDKMRKAMKNDPKLCEAIHASLKRLELRPFDRKMVTSVIDNLTGSILTAADIDAFCGPEGGERTLVDVRGVKNFGDRYDQTDEDRARGAVTISFYENPDVFYKKGEKGVHFIEATGPWHKITWLETSMMQCVYETKMRYDLAKKEKTYKQWLYGALLRCAKSVAYTRLIQSKHDIVSALFTGRRTGGLLFLLLQNLFFADHFKQLGSLWSGAIAGNFTETKALGTSSCDSWYLLTNMGLPCLNPSGTHAHELSMVTSVLFPQVDQNEFHIPVTQVIGHYLYSELVWKKMGKKGPMPMLPDTLGSRGFMRAAKYLTIPDESGKQQPFLNIISSARQDSGDLSDFAENMKDFGYTGSKMASEIDTTGTLLEAAELGYNSFGAGGFFGDSEKVWGNKDASSNSMAVKAVRVMYKDDGKFSIDGIPYIKNEGEMITGYPVKIGDPAERSKPQLAEGKLSLDKNLPVEILEKIKTYAETVRVSSAAAAKDIGQKALSSIITIERGLVAVDVVGGKRKSKSRKSRKARKAIKSRKSRKL